MQQQLMLPLFFFIFLLSRSPVEATKEKFLGQLAGAVIGGAAQAMLGMPPAQGTAPAPPTPEEVAAEKALARARDTSEAAEGAKETVKTLKDTYGEMETDLAIPLAQNTAELKEERLRLMHQLSLLTAQTRQLFDSLHADMVMAPLLIVAKTADDDRRNEANKLDAKGKKDALEGIVSPCSAFHEEREAEKREIEAAQDKDIFKEEAKTLAMMNPQERMQYDKTMAEENAAKVEELQNTIKYEQKQAGILSPTQRLLLGAVAPLIPRVPTP